MAGRSAWSGRFSVEAPASRWIRTDRKRRIATVEDAAAIRANCAEALPALVGNQLVHPRRGKGRVFGSPVVKIRGAQGAWWKSRRRGGVSSCGSRFVPLQQREGRRDRPRMPKRTRRKAGGRRGSRPWPRRRGSLIPVCRVRSQRTAAGPGKRDRRRAGYAAEGTRQRDDPATQGVAQARRRLARLQ